MKRGVFFRPPVPLAAQAVEKLGNKNSPVALLRLTAFRALRPLPWAGAQDFKAAGRDGPHGRFYSFAMQSYKK